MDKQQNQKTVDSLLQFLRQCPTEWALDGRRIRCGGDCPLTFMANRLTGAKFGFESFLRAAESIGINNSTSRMIAMAADGKIDSDEAVELRPRLMAACGLAEAQ